MELRNPGLDESGQPLVQVKLDVEGEAGDKPVRMSAPMMKAQLQPLNGMEGRYALASEIPLAKFSPGTYSIKVKIFDSITKSTWELEKSFDVVE